MTDAKIIDIRTGQPRGEVVPRARRVGNLYAMAETHPAGGYGLYVLSDRETGGWNGSRVGHVWTWPEAVEFLETGEVPEEPPTS